MSGRGRGKKVLFSKKVLLSAVMAAGLITLLAVFARGFANAAIPISAGGNGGAVTLALTVSPGGSGEEGRRAAERLGERLSREVILIETDEAGAARAVRDGTCDAAVGYLPSGALPGFGLMKSRPLKRKTVVAVSNHLIASLEDLAGVNAGYLSGFAPEQEQALGQAEDIRLHLYGDEEALWSDLIGGMTECALVDRETAGRFLKRQEHLREKSGADGQGEGLGDAPIRASRLRAVRLTDAPVRELCFFTNSRELLEEINRTWEGE